MTQDLQNAERVCVGTSTPESTGAGGTRIRPVERDDGPALHALLTATISDVLPDRARWLLRWSWQYWQNPYREDRPAGWVFVDGDRILGHLGAVYLPLRLGGRRVVGAIGADYAVGDDIPARGGLFAALELVQRLFTDCGDCVVMATTANEKTGAVFGRFGGRPVEWTREFWRAPATLRQQIRSCRGAGNRIVRRMMTGRLGSWVTQAAAAGHRLANHSPAIPIPRGCWLEMTVPRLARDLGQLWLRVMAAAMGAESSQPTASALSLSVDRSQDYLDWRYGQHPEREHVRVLVVRDSEGVPLGAAVLFREHRHDRYVVYVEDIIVLPHRRDVMRTLLCAALRLACDHGADHLVTAPGCRTIRDIFWELGFEDRARNAPAAVVSIPPSDSLCDDHFEFWHGMMF